MKLTEQQIAHIFQQSTRHTNEAVDVADCLGTPNAANAETLVSDFTSAQSAKLAVHMQSWSQNVAHELTTGQRPHWTQRLKRMVSQWLPNSPVALPALAVVFTLSAVVFLSQQPINGPTMNTDVVTNDVINSLPFEGDNDRLSKGGFDGGSSEQDRLFKANFS